LTKSLRKHCQKHVSIIHRRIGNAYSAIAKFSPAHEYRRLRRLNIPK